MNGFGAGLRGAALAEMDANTDRTATIATVARLSVPTPQSSAQGLPDPARYTVRPHKGLIGFDVETGSRTCDRSCSDSLNGAKNRSAKGDFALAA